MSAPPPRPGLPGTPEAGPRPATAGWFGKIPALGDFASRRLPASFIEAWDEWLSTEIFEARQALGPDWAPSYGNAPTWRFALMPGVLDSAYWYGILAPSEDRVGRQFPLTLAACCEGPADDLEAWWAALIGVARRAADPGCDADSLDVALVAALQAEGCTASGACGGGAHSDLATGGRGASLWWPWRSGSSDFGPVSAFDGLPRGPRFIQLICAVAD
jgi:type VI secretion system protein ImpM